MMSWKLGGLGIRAGGLKEGSGSFLKKEPKNFCPLRLHQGALWFRQRAFWQNQRRPRCRRGGKVFWFFFSKKNCFLTNHEKAKQMRRRDWWGLATAAVAAALLILYRLYFLEPRGWGAACVAAMPPLACMPRAALIWMQGRYLLGAGALVVGMVGFAWGGGFAAQLGAVVLGVAAIENYNATWGAIGLALGAWGWLRRTGWRGRQPA